MSILFRQNNLWSLNVCNTGCHSIRLFFSWYLFRDINFLRLKLYITEWRHFSVVDSDTTGHVGLVHGCKFPNGDENACSDWWSNRPKWEKLAKGFFVAGMAVELIALCWIGWSFILCCFHKRFMHVLPLWSILVTVLLAVGVIVFYSKYKDDAEQITKDGKISKYY